MSADKVVIDGELDLLNVFMADMDAFVPADCMAYETGTFTPMTLTNSVQVPFARPHTAAPVFVMFCFAGNSYMGIDTASSWLYFSNIRGMGLWQYFNQANHRSAVAYATYKKSGDQEFSTEIQTYVNENNANVTNTGFTATCNAKKFVNRPYKWLAIWKAGQS